MFDKLKGWVVDQVLWAETNMKGKTGAEKRAAVVQKIDDAIQLPWWLEYFDGPLIGWLVDRACAMFNEKAGHDWKDIAPTEAAREALAQELPDVEAYTRAADELANTAKEVVNSAGGVVNSAKETAQKTVETAKETVQEAMATLADAAKITATGAQTSDKLSAHFSKKEFVCKCCGKFIPCPELVEKLEKFRALCGNKPMVIGSGTRCLKHNKAVGGAMPDEKKGKMGSQHLYGTAADVQKISGLTVDQMAKLAEQAGFNGIGKYNWGVHVDVRKTPARWDYRK